MKSDLLEHDDMTGVEFHNRSASGNWDMTEAESIQHDTQPSVVRIMLDQLASLAEEAGVDLDALARDASLAFVPESESPAMLSRTDAEALAEREVRGFPW